jgi:transposase InsO family protein
MLYLFSQRKVLRRAWRSSVNARRPCRVSRLSDALNDSARALSAELPTSLIDWRSPAAAHAAANALDVYWAPWSVLNRNRFNSDAGGQYTAIRYTDALTAVGAVPSIGSVGDGYDNALAESTIGQVKAELIHRRGP